MKNTELKRMLEKEYGLIGIDGTLLEKSMTTKSYTKERYDKGEIASPDGFDYQELELIGDKVIGLIVAEQLLQQGTTSEGSLTEEISSIVDNDNLKKVSRNLELYKHVNIGNGQNILDTKIEADIFESLTGALYFSLGYITTKLFIIRVLFGGQMNRSNTLTDCTNSDNHVERKNILQRVKEEQQNRLKAKSEIKTDNYKNTLQEMCQQNGHPVPKYELVSKSGEDHKPMFIVEVYVSDTCLGSGEGTSKKIAEKSAAKQAIVKMDKVIKN